MKYLRFLMILAILVLALGSYSGSVKAADYKFAYKTTINLQNLSSNSASVSFTYYHSTGSYGTAGTVATTSTADLLGNEFRAFVTLPVNTGFKGSVVISSSQPIAAVSNIDGNSLYANASYIGSSAGATSIGVPLLMKGNYGYDTWYTVQNTGSGDATVDATYSDGTTAQKVIVSGASETFNQATETHSQKVFSATLSSNQPVVVTVVEESANTLFAYNGFTSTSKFPVMPLINENNWGYTSSITLQNTGSTATDVTVSYTPSSSKTGTACTEKQTIAAGTNATFVTFAFTNTTGAPASLVSDCTKGSLFVGSAAVTTNSGDQPLVAVVNQHKLGVNGEAYAAFDVSAATPKVVVPLLMERNYGWFTSINIMNVGTTTVDIYCDLTNTTTGDFTKTNVAPNTMINVEQLNAVAAGWTGSGTCVAYQPGTTTVDTNAKLVGAVNELKTSSTDTFMVYEAINVQP